MSAASVACSLGAIIGRFVLDGAHERAQSGRLEFHDLLVLARRLVATRRDIRHLLHARYPRILLDEFQDTDPIQLEIAVRLTARPDDPAQDSDWRQLVPVPGRLFIVGDPKQSIYRFRRADIAQYLRAADQVGADQVHLTANFRSTSAVIDFVNDVFGRLITYQLDAQPAFGPLDACRRVDLLGHGTVTVLGSDVVDVSLLDEDEARLGDPEMGAADALRLVEARDVVATITTALADGWPVFDGALGTVRPCVPGDICVLLPTRISLPALEAEFRDAALPYRAENSSVVYASSEVRAVLLALRAADDPTDNLALVASLRSPLYGCSDVELWEWTAAGGTWGLWAPPPDGSGASCRSPRPSPTCGPSPSDRGSFRPLISSPRSPTSGASSTSPSPAATPATCGAGCATSSSRPGRGPTPVATDCAGICTGRRCRRRRAGSPTRSFPSTTTTPSVS